MRMKYPEIVDASIGIVLYIYIKNWKIYNFLKFKF